MSVCVSVFRVYAPYLRALNPLLGSRDVLLGPDLAGETTVADVDAVDIAAEVAIESLVPSIRDHLADQACTSVLFAKISNR